MEGVLTFLCLQQYFSVFLHFKARVVKLFSILTVYCAVFLFCYAATFSVLKIMYNTLIPIYAATTGGAGTQSSGTCQKGRGA